MRQPQMMGKDELRARIKELSQKSDMHALRADALKAELDEVIEDRDQWKFRFEETEGEWEVQYKYIKDLEEELCKPDG